MHINRTLSESVLRLSQSFPIVLVTGPRQVGKTTLLQELSTHNRTYISLDDINVRSVAQTDPTTFLSRLHLPVLIDEAQYAPELFSAIKMIVDRERTPGLFWLTGSQAFGMMKYATESLAGRMAILNLQGISLDEELNHPQLPPFLPTPEAIDKRASLITKPMNIADIYHTIWRGSYPHVVRDKGETWEAFYSSYVTTYIERDVRQSLNIQNIGTFQRFMQIAAARTGTSLNYRQMAIDVGVSEPTIKSWFETLKASGLVTIIEPYFNNISKRLIKTPKFYFLDTGLCCFLTGWLTSTVLERGHMAGLMLETFVVSEVIKSYLHHGRKPRIYYYADKDQNEVDILLEENGVLHPIEVKKSGSLANMHFKGFKCLEGLKKPIGHGCVLCFVESIVPISPLIDAVPIGYV